MNNLLALMSVLQLTKEQPLTGFLAAGIGREETSSLAEHHYTTTIISLLLAQKIKSSGGKINERKVVIMSLIHDLSEIFGGDIAAPLGRQYPELREAKDKIGIRAMEMLIHIGGEEFLEEWLDLWNEIHRRETDEAILVCIADQMDHQLFLEHKSFSQKCNRERITYRPKFVENHIFALADKISNPINKKVLEDFFVEFKKNYFEKGFYSIIGRQRV